MRLGKVNVTIIWRQQGARQDAEITIRVDLGEERLTATELVELCKKRASEYCRKKGGKFKKVTSTIPVIQQ